MCWQNGSSNNCPSFSSELSHLMTELSLFHYCQMHLCSVVESQCLQCGVISKLIDKKSFRNHKIVTVSEIPQQELKWVRTAVNQFTVSSRTSCERELNAHFCVHGFYTLIGRRTGWFRNCQFSSEWQPFLLPGWGLFGERAVHTTVWITSLV